MHPLLSGVNEERELSIKKNEGKVSMLGISFVP